MREIKFRVWNGQQFLRSYANKGETFEYLHENGKIVGLDWFIQCQRLETPQRFWVQQYTGLKDKDGREIYEGDILKQDSAIEVVSWTDWLCGFSPFCNWDEYGRCGVNFSPMECKIIGNIFENSELLKKYD